MVGEQTATQTRGRARPVDVKKEWMSVKEIIVITGFGTSTVYEAIASGALKSIRKGRAIRVRRSDLDAWMSA